MSSHPLVFHLEDFISFFRLSSFVVMAVVQNINNDEGGGPGDVFLIYKQMKMMLVCV